MDSINYQTEQGPLPPSSNLTSSYSQPPGTSHGGPPTNFAPPYPGWSQRLPGQTPFLEFAPRSPFSETPQSPHSSLPPLRNNLNPPPGSNMEGTVLPLPMQPIPHTGMWWNHASYQPYLSTFDQPVGQLDSSPIIPDESFLLPPMARSRAIPNHYRTRAEVPLLNANVRARNDRLSALQPLSPGPQIRHSSQHRQPRQRPNTRLLGTTQTIGISHSGTSVERRRPRTRAELPNPSAYNMQRHSEPGPEIEPDRDGQPETSWRRRGARNTRATQSEDVHIFLQAQMQNMRSLIAQQPRRVASKAMLQSMQSVDIQMLPEDERTCSICYNEFGTNSPEGVNEAPLRLPKCQHVFGDHCIKKWFEDSDSCPYCRDKVPSELKGYEAARQFLNMMRLRGQTPMDIPQESLLSLLELSDEMDLYRDSLSPSPSSDSDSAEDSTRQPEHSSPRSRQETRRAHAHRAQPTLRPVTMGSLAGHTTAPPVPYVVEPRHGTAYTSNTAPLLQSEMLFGLNHARGVGQDTTINSGFGIGDGSRSRRPQASETTRRRPPAEGAIDQTSSPRSAQHRPFSVENYWE